MMAAPESKTTLYDMFDFEVHGVSSWIGDTYTKAEFAHGIDTVVKSAIGKLSSLPRSDRTRQHRVPERYYRLSPEWLRSSRAQVDHVNQVQQLGLHLTLCLLHLYGYEIHDGDVVTYPEESTCYLVHKRKLLTI